MEAIFPTIRMREKAPNARVKKGRIRVAEGGLISKIGIFKPFELEGFASKSDFSSPLLVRNPKSPKLGNSIFFR
jgi:hypothetical protein